MQRLFLAAAAAMCVAGAAVAAVKEVKIAQDAPTVPVAPAAAEAMPADALSLAHKNVSLSPRQERRLAEGGRVFVIVELDIGSDLAAPQADSAGLKAKARGIGAAQEAFLARAFGFAAAQLADADKTMPGGPRLRSAFRYTPGLAMTLDRAEIARLAADPGVARIIEDAAVPPLLDESNVLIGSSTLHGAGHTGSGRAVAVLDSGVDDDHVMFAGKTPASACFNTSNGLDIFSTCPNGLTEQESLVDGAAGDNCTEDNDDIVNGTDGCFHGTHVGGIAAGASATFSFSSVPRTLFGVARGANVVGINVFSRFTDPGDCGGVAPCILSFTSDQIEALEWLVDNGAAFSVASANMSLGGGFFATHCDLDSRKPVIDQLRALGIATVIATGNDSFTTGIGGPGCISTAIAVGSTTKIDEISSFSNSAPPVAGVPMVDFLAPGSSIRSAFPACPAGSAAGCAEGASRAATASGTSMATPHVAGAFALVKARSPGASVTEIEEALKATGLPFRDPRNGVITPRIRPDLASNLLVAGGVDIGALDIAPASGGALVGLAGAPGSFNTLTYTLTNNGGATVSWSVDSADAPLDGVSKPAAASWLSISPTSGQITAGGSQVVTVSANPAGLVGGDVREGLVTFTSGQATTQRAVALYAQSSITFYGDPPINDNFANALTIAGHSFAIQTQNNGATQEVGEPLHGGGLFGDIGGSSMWWRWTAPSSGPMTIDTFGSPIDTTLGVYTGSAVNALTVVVQNDDAGGGLQSQVAFSAVAGTTYRIAVDGFDGEEGQITLTMGPQAAQANNNFASAVALAGPAGALGGHNMFATAEAGEPAHAGSPAGQSVWYTLTPTGSGQINLDTEGSAIDTRLAVYTGAAVNALTPVASNDNRPASAPGDKSAPQAQAQTSRLSFNATGGVTYRIAIDNVGGVGGVGDFRLSWSTGAPATVVFGAVAPASRAVRVGATATAFASIVNAGQAPADDCHLAPPEGLDSSFLYQTTNPIDNSFVGPPNTPADIGVGASQSFFFSMTPTVLLGGENVEIAYRCANAATTTAIAGLNTFLLSSAVATPADVIAIFATPAGDPPGVVRVPINGATAYGLAGFNFGAADTVTLAANVGGLPLSIALCETFSGGPMAGQCMAAPQPNQITVAFGASETKTFSIFLTGQGVPISFDPAVNRIASPFTTATGTVGLTSVAVQTIDP